MRRLLLIFCAATLVFTTGCNKNDGPELPEIEVSPELTDITFEAVGAPSVTYTVESPDWDVAITPAGGPFTVTKGADGFAVSAVNNMDPKVVDGYKLTLTADGFRRTVVKLSQKAFEASVFSASTTSAGVAENFGGGAGTENDPYLIAGASHLKALVERTNGPDAVSYQSKYFRMTADIHVEADVDWKPIADSTSYNNINFQGNFDGNGHKISGTLKGSALYFGVFGGLEIDSRVEEFTVGVKGLAVLADVINLYNGDGVDCFTGAIAGHITWHYRTPVTISGCTVTGNVTGGNGTKRSSTGGIVGFAYNAAVVSGCTVSGNVKGGNAQQSYTGGIVGQFVGHHGGSLTGNTVTADVIGGICGSESSDFAATGGIVGYNDRDVHTSVCIGNVSANSGNSDKNNYVGGISGYTTYRWVSIYNCCRCDDGKVTGNTGNQKDNADKRVGQGLTVAECPEEHRQP